MGPSRPSRFRQHHIPLLRGRGLGRGGPGDKRAGQHQPNHHQPITAAVHSTAPKNPLPPPWERVRKRVIRGQKGGATPSKPTPSHHQGTLICHKHSPSPARRERVGVRARGGAGPTNQTNQTLHHRNTPANQHPVPFAQRKGTRGSEATSQGMPGADGQQGCPRLPEAHHSIIRWGRSTTGRSSQITRRPERKQTRSRRRVKIRRTPERGTYDIRI